MPPAPDGGELHEAALRHLARYAATEAGLARVLGRRIDRWARAQADAAPAGAAPAGQAPASEMREAIAAAAAAAKTAIPPVIARLRAAGLLSDAGFAASRARRLTQAGKSRRAAFAHLAAKGVAAAIAAASLPEDAARELAAACVFLRRRRAGPFGPADAMKTLAALARAGFTRDTALAALRLPREEAQARIGELSK